MPISDQQTVFHHVGNGLTITFPFGCQILQPSDLQVYLNDELTTSGFGVSGIGVPTGGAVTFDIPPADLLQVRIERVIPLERTTDYQQNGDYLARVVNPDFNRIWMALQQHQTMFNRALSTPKSDPAAPALLPPIADRANKLLGFDVNGNPVAVVPAEQSASALEIALSGPNGVALVGNAVDKRELAEGALNSKADPTGATDSTALIQAAIDSLFNVERIQTQGGGVVVLPRGNFKVSTLRMKRGVSLRGAGQRATRLFTVTAVPMIVMDTPTDPAGNQSGFTIERLMLDGGGANQLAGASRIGTIGIDASGMGHATVRDCLIQRFATAGIYSRGLVVDFNVERSFIIANTVGVDHRDGFATTIRYIGCQIVFNDTTGAILKDIPVSSFLHTIVEKNYGTGLYLYGATSSSTIDHCYFEDNGTSVNLHIDGGLSTVVSNNYFTYTPNKGVGLSLVSVGNASGVSLIGNTFNGAATGNGASADISAAAGAAQTIYICDNKHVGGFSRVGGSGGYARLYGDAYKVVRGDTPGIEYQNAAGGLLAKEVITSGIKESRHAVGHKWADMAGNYHMQLDAAGLVLNGGGWNTRHLMLGGTHLWVDGTAKLRIKFGAPTSDTDGAVVGAQV